jgi:uncharacterized protein (DUF2345 family)
VVTGISEVLKSVALESGVLAGFDPQGQPVVIVAGPEGELAAPAKTVIPLSDDHVGSELVLWLREGDLIILGRVLREREVRLPPLGPGTLSVEADGRKISVDAAQQLVLRSGKASITLTAAGKVIIRGDYVLSRSTGVNQIKGASIQIN